MLHHIKDSDTPPIPPPVTPSHTTPPHMCQPLKTELKTTFGVYSCQTTTIEWMSEPDLSYQ